MTGAPLVLMVRSVALTPCEGVSLDAASMSYPYCTMYSMSNRDEAAKLLPGFLLDAILPDGGFAKLVAESYKPPSNKAEAEVHSDLLDQGHLILRKGWPDFCVITRNDMFAVEVKHSDWLSPSQRVVTEMLVRAGIDTYVASKPFGQDRYTYETIGHSTDWVDRAEEEA